MACVHAVMHAVIQLSLLQCSLILWTVLCNSLSLHLCYAMLMAVPHGLGACSAACCDSAQFVAVWLNLMGSHVQQHIASCVFSCVLQC